MKKNRNKNGTLNKVINRIIGFNKFILPFTITITLSFLIIEAFTYSGFILQHLFIDSKLFMVINILMLLFNSLINSAGINISETAEVDLLILVVKGSYLAVPILAIIYYIMIAVESANFPNYIFSTLHINPDSFFSVLVFSAIISISGLLSKIDLTNFDFNQVNDGSNIPRTKNFRLNINDNKFQLIVTMLFVVVFGYFILQNFILTSKRIVKSNIYILVNKNSTYDEKMYESWHFFYKYMKFIVDNTSENSSIAIPPPIRPWLSEGNSVLVRYFLFPRYVVTIEDESGRVINPDYYIISKGIWKATLESEYGWPKEKIEAEEIIYLNEKDFSIKTIKNVVYDPEIAENKYGWGLIKVKK
jgi:hypothetical protein